MREWEFSIILSIFFFLKHTSGIASRQIYMVSQTVVMIVTTNLLSTNSLKRT